MWYARSRRRLVAITCIGSRVSTSVLRRVSRPCDVVVLRLVDTLPVKPLDPRASKSNGSAWVYIIGSILIRRRRGNALVLYVSAFVTVNFFSCLSYAGNGAWLSPPGDGDVAEIGTWSEPPTDSTR